MIRRIIVHAGHFKTGTSTVQDILSRNRNLLAANGFLYPDTSSGQHSYHLYFWRDDYRAHNERYWREFAENLKTAPEETLVLSAETVSSYRRSDFQRLSILFSGLPIYIVLSLRHWSGFLPSRWRQNIVRCDSMSFREFLDASSTNYFKSIDGDFGLIVRRASRYAQQVRVSFYSRADGVADVMRQIFGPTDLAARLTADTTWRNSSRNYVSVEVNRMFNEIANDLLGRRRDSRYTTLRDGADLRDPLDLSGCAAAFQAQRSDASVRLQALIEESRRSTTVAASGLPLSHWTARLSRTLSSLDCVPPPRWWGSDEAEAIVDFTELRAQDLGTDVAQAIAAQFQAWWTDR